MGPVFIFGTGRCGSTHIQRVITLATCCWVWGEHEGFLGPLLESVSRYEKSERLDRNIFSIGPRSDAELISDMSSGSERLSWLNRLDKTEFRGEISVLVDRMFRSHVPKGWTQWGFKEIRYGLNNDAPEILLTLFPTATAIFTFRDPATTIQSMIRAWGKPGLLDDEASSSNISETYRNCTRIWKIVVRYFLEHKRNCGDKIHFMSEDKLSLPIAQILHALELPCERAISYDLKVTNAGPRNWPLWASKQFDDLYSKDEAECRSLYKRACAESDADFGSSVRHFPS